MAVEVIWHEVEAIVSPIIELLEVAPVFDAPLDRPAPAHEYPAALWMSAAEVAPLLRTTAHSLRRLAREGRSPIPAHHIGSRWWFARAEVDRFLGSGDR